MTRTKASVLIAAALFASNAFGEDLLQVYRAARAFDAPYASARQLLEATREKIPQGRAGLLPLINANANRTWNYVDVNSPGRTFDELRFRNQGWGATLTQPLYRPANWTVMQQAELQVVQAESVFSQSGQDLILRVAQAYFDVLAAQDTLDFIAAKKAAISEQLAQARRNFEVGTATITDTNEAQARFDLAIAEEIAGRNDLEVRRRALAQTAGEQYTALTPLRTKVSIPGAEPPDVKLWITRAFDQSHLVRAQEALWEIARREVDRNRAGHLPTLDLVASSTRGQGLNVNNALRTDTWTNVIGVQLNIPIYAGGAVDSRVREAVALRERARFDLDNIRRTAEFNTSQAFLSYTNGLAQVRALEQALVSSETALASNKLGYEVGVRINIDVLNAQQQVFQTRRDLSKARYDTILNGLRLKSAAGSLSEEDLAAVNQLLGTT
jgi:outer membrane protein